jgi:hypothetical protein
MNIDDHVHIFIYDVLVVCEPCVRPEFDYLDLCWSYYDSAIG